MTEFDPSIVNTNSIPVADGCGKLLIDAKTLAVTVVFGETVIGVLPPPDFCVSAHQVHVWIDYARRKFNEADPTRGGFQKVYDAFIAANKSFNESKL